MSRNLLGPIPDDYFENDPIYPPPKTRPLSKELVEWIETLKREIQAARLEKIEKFRDPKYHTGDIIGPF